MVEWKTAVLFSVLEEIYKYIYIKIVRNMNYRLRPSGSKNVGVFVVDHSNYG